MSVFSRGNEQVDFKAWTVEGQDLTRPFAEQQARIVERDSEYQRQVASRGGTMTSSLTDEAQAAVAKVRHKRAAALARFGRQKEAIISREYQRLAEEARTTYEAASQAQERLAEFEDALGTFLRRVELPQPPKVADRDLSARAHDFGERSKRAEEHLLNPPVQRVVPVTPQPVPVPDFDGLVVISTQAD
jgi:hypothetical protein